MALVREVPDGADLVEITQMINASSFYVLPSYSDIESWSKPRAQLEMMEMFLSAAKLTTIPKPAAPRVQELVVVKHPDTGNWHRGRVLSVGEAQRGLHSVMLIDYGRIVEVPTSALRDIDPYYAKQEAFSFRILLSGIVPGRPTYPDSLMYREEWSNAANIFVKKWTTKSRLCYFLKKGKLDSENIFCGELFLVAENGFLNLGKLLCKQKFAIADFSLFKERYCENFIRDSSGLPRMLPSCGVESEAQFGNSLTQGHLPSSVQHSKYSQSKTRKKKKNYRELRSSTVKEGLQKESLTNWEFEEKLAIWRIQNEINNTATDSQNSHSKSEFLRDQDSQRRENIQDIRMGDLQKGANIRHPELEMPTFLEVPTKKNSSHEYYDCTDEPSTSTNNSYIAQNQSQITDKSVAMEYKGWNDERKSSSDKSFGDRISQSYSEDSFSDSRSTNNRSVQETQEKNQFHANESMLRNSENVRENPFCDSAFRRKSADQSSSSQDKNFGSNLHPKTNESPDIKIFDIPEILPNKIYPRQKVTSKNDASKVLHEQAGKEENASDRRNVLRTNETSSKKFVDNDQTEGGSQERNTLSSENKFENGMRPKKSNKEVYDVKNTSQKHSRNEEHNRGQCTFREDKLLIPNKTSKRNSTPKWVVQEYGSGKSFSSKRKLKQPVHTYYPAGFNMAVADQLLGKISPGGDSPSNHVKNSVSCVIDQGKSSSLKNSQEPSGREKDASDSLNGRRSSGASPNERADNVQVKGRGRGRRFPSQGKKFGSEIDQKNSNEDMCDAWNSSQGHRRNETTLDIPNKHNKKIISEANVSQLSLEECNNCMGEELFTGVSESRKLDMLNPLIYAKNRFAGQVNRSEFSPERSKTQTAHETTLDAPHIHSNVVNHVSSNKKGQVSGVPSTEPSDMHQEISALVKESKKQETLMESIGKNLHASEDFYSISVPSTSGSSKETRLIHSEREIKQNCLMSDEANKLVPSTSESLIHNERETKQDCLITERSKNSETLSTLYSNDLENSSNGDVKIDSSSWNKNTEKSSTLHSNDKEKKYFELMPLESKQDDRKLECTSSSSTSKTCDDNLFKLIENEQNNVSEKMDSVEVVYDGLVLTENKSKEAAFSQTSNMLNPEQLPCSPEHRLISALKDFLSECSITNANSKELVNQLLTNLSKVAEKSDSEMPEISETNNTVSTEFSTKAADVGVTIQVTEAKTCSQASCIKVSDTSPVVTTELKVGSSRMHSDAFQNNELKILSDGILKTSTSRIKKVVGNLASEAMSSDVSNKILSQDVTEIFPSEDLVETLPSEKDSEAIPFSVNESIQPVKSRIRSNDVSNCRLTDATVYRSTDTFEGKPTEVSEAKAAEVLDVRTGVMKTKSFESMEAIQCEVPVTKYAEVSETISSEVLEIRPASVSENKPVDILDPSSVNISDAKQAEIIEISPLESARVETVKDVEVRAAVPMEMKRIKPSEIAEASDNELTESRSTADTEVKPTAEREVRPTLRIGGGPMAHMEVKPTMHTEVGLMADTEVRPAVDTEAGPVADTDVRLRASTEVGPTAGTEVRPAVSIEIRQAAAAEVRPAADTEFQPNEETNMKQSAVLDTNLGEILETRQTQEVIPTNTSKIKQSEVTDTIPKVLETVLFETSDNSTLRNPQTSKYSKMKNIKEEDLPDHSLCESNVLSDSSTVTSVKMSEVVSTEVSEIKQSAGELVERIGGVLVDKESGLKLDVREVSQPAVSENFSNKITDSNTINYKINLKDNRLKGDNSSNKEDSERVGQDDNKMKISSKILSHRIVNVDPDPCVSLVLNPGRKLMDQLQLMIVLLHGAPETFRHLNVVRDAVLRKDVHEVLKTIMNRLMRIQKYAWPLIQQGYSCAIVNPPMSGKTLGYAVPLLDQLMQLVEMDKIPKGNGPVMLVLCSGSKSCISIRDLFYQFIRRSLIEVKMLVAYGGGAEKIEFKLVNGCHILISTPRCFKRLLALGKVVVNFHRLKYLVLDEADILTLRFLPEVELICKSIERNIKQEKGSLQVVATAEKWCPGLEGLVRSLPRPVVCIGAFMEALVYAHLKPHVYYVPQNAKISVVKEILEETFKKHRILVICGNMQEVEAVYGALKSSFELMMAHDKMDTSDIHDIYVKWSWMQKPALICTDAILQEMSFQGATLLIHFSLGTVTRREFAFRCSTLIDQMPSMFESQSEKDAMLRPEMHIFITEEDKAPLPVLIRFLKRLGVTVDPDLQKRANAAEVEKEIKKDYVPLCFNTKTFGDCWNRSKCIFRHVIDSRDKPRNIPLNGAIKVKILNVHDACNFSARILEHINENGNTTVMRNLIISISRNLKTYFNDETNRIFFERPKAYDVGAIEGPPGVFRRVEILAITKVDRNENPVELLVRFIDEGCSELVKAEKLFELPQNLQEIPPQSVELHLCRLIPCDLDWSWGTITNEKVAKILSEAENKARYLLGKIKFCLGHSLWVDPLECYETLPTLKTDRIIFSLRRRLLDEQLAVDNPQHLQLLYQACARGGLEVPNTSASDTSSNERTEEKIDISWAHLPADEFSLVYFIVGDHPGRFYIRQQKFEDLVHKLDKKLYKIAKGERAYSDRTLFTGDYCIGRFPTDDRWYRARVENAQDDNLDLFFVDHGDRATVSRSEAILLPKDLISQLPFQAIECCFAGIGPDQGDRWSEKSIDALYEITAKAGTVDGVKLLYAKVFDKMKPADCTGGYKYQIALIEVTSHGQALLNNSLVAWGLASQTEEQKQMLLALDFSHLTLPVELPSDDELEEEVEEDEDEQDEGKIEEQSLNSTEIAFEEDWNRPLEQSSFNTSTVSCSLDSTSSTEARLESSFIDFDFSAVTENEIMEFFEKSMEDYNTKVSYPETTPLTVSERQEEKNAPDEEASESTEALKASAEGKSEGVQVTEPDENNSLNESDHSCSSRDEEMENSDAGSESSTSLPALIRITRTPLVYWHQNAYFVWLRVDLPGVEKYYLKWDVGYIQFWTLIEDLVYMFELNLYGPINPETLTHNGGLFVRIKMEKVFVGMDWLRLRVEPVKVTWLKRDYDAENDSDIEELHLAEQLRAIKEMEGKEEDRIEKGGLLPADEAPYVDADESGSNCSDIIPVEEEYDPYDPMN